MKISFPLIPYSVSFRHSDNRLNDEQREARQLRNQPGDGPGRNFTDRYLLNGRIKIRKTMRDNALLNQARSGRANYLPLPPDQIAAVRSQLQQWTSAEAAPGVHAARQQVSQALLGYLSSANPNQELNLSRFPGMSGAESLPEGVRNLIPANVRIRYAQAPGQASASHQVTAVAAVAEQAVQGRHSPASSGRVVATTGSPEHDAELNTILDTIRTALHEWPSALQNMSEATSSARRKIANDIEQTLNRGNFPVRVHNDRVYLNIPATVTLPDGLVASLRAAGLAIKLGRPGRQGNGVHTVSLETDQARTSRHASQPGQPGVIQSMRPAAVAQAGPSNAVESAAAAAGAPETPSLPLNLRILLQAWLSEGDPARDFDARRSTAEEFTRLFTEGRITASGDPVSSLTLPQDFSLPPSLLDELDKASIAIQRSAPEAGNTGRPHAAAGTDMSLERDYVKEYQQKLSDWAAETGISDEEKQNRDEAVARIQEGLGQLGGVHLRLDDLPHLRSLPPIIARVREISLAAGSVLANTERETLPYLRTRLGTTINELPQAASSGGEVRAEENAQPGAGYFRPAARERYRDALHEWRNETGITLEERAARLNVSAMIARVLEISPATSGGAIALDLTQLTTAPSTFPPLREDRKWQVTVRPGQFPQAALVDAARLNPRRLELIYSSDELPQVASPSGAPRTEEGNAAIGFPNVFIAPPDKYKAAMSAWYEASEKGTPERSVRRKVFHMIAAARKASLGGTDPIVLDFTQLKGAPSTFPPLEAGRKWKITVRPGQFSQAELNELRQAEDVTLISSQS